MTLEVAKVEIETLKELCREQREEMKLLRNEVSSLREAIVEIKVGKKWFLAMLGASATAGALIDTTLRALRVY